MIEPKKIIVDGLEFNLQPLPALEAMKLDKRVTTLLIPLIGGLKDLSLDADIDFETAARGLYEAFNRMDDNEFQSLVVNLLRSVQYLPQGGAPTELTQETINQIFMGKLVSIYKLMIEVMRFNKFSPFELVGAGNVITKILSSTKRIQKEKPSGNASVKSDGLLET